MKQHTPTPAPVVISAEFNGKNITLHLQNSTTGVLEPIEVPNVHQGKPLACMGVLTAPLFEPCVFFAYNPDQRWREAEALSWPIQDPNTIKCELDAAWDAWMVAPHEQAAD